MKRILKAISILLLAFLVGCSGTKEETKVYTKQQKGVTMELTFYYKGDKVVKQTSKNTIVYADLGLTKEQVKKQLDPVAKKYRSPTLKISISHIPLPKPNHIIQNN